MKRTAPVLLAMLCAVTTASADSYHVQRGDTLTSIARMHNMDVQDVILRNAEFLLDRYRAVCGTKSVQYTKSATRRGYFCNDNRHTSHANTLLAGWKIELPTKEAAASIVEEVTKLPWRRVALVVDATGSMQGNIQHVADHYRAALSRLGKHISGIWLFSDGRVWQVSQHTFLSDYKPTGRIENTYSALLEASKSNPEGIVLITDEEGDDWPRDWRLAHLPPVLAHCLQVQGSGPHLCEPTLTMLTRLVPGSRYVRGLSLSQQPLAQEQKVLPKAVPIELVVPPTAKTAPPDWRYRVFAR